MGMEEAISFELRIGTLISVILIAIGAALLFLHNGSGSLSLNAIATSNSLINSAGFDVPAVISAVEGLQGLGFIFLGLVVLIATPIIRVLLSILFFAEESNWLYVIITLIVLFDLLLAIFVVPGLIGAKVV